MVAANRRFVRSHGTELSAEARNTARRATVAIAGYLRGAPGTTTWLAILFVTSIIAKHVAPEQLDRMLGNRSTNLHHLAEDPLRVLVSSAFWIDGGGWVVYVLLYGVFHNPAERWLGTLRWLTVVVIAHVGATYISEGLLYAAIEHGAAPQSAVNTLDVGVSYALAGVVGVLTYHIATPWRYGYLVGCVAFYGIPLSQDVTFTAVGHFCALLLGLACYPLTIHRHETWNPSDTWATWRRRVTASRRRTTRHRQ